MECWKGSEKDKRSDSIVTYGTNARLVNFNGVSTFSVPLLSDCFWLWIDCLIIKLHRKMRRMMRKRSSILRPVD